MNNLLIYLLHFYQKTQKYTTHTLLAIHQCQKDHAKDSLIDYTPMFDGELELYFDWIMRLENLAAVSKQNPKEWASGKLRVWLSNVSNLYHWTQVGTM